MKKEDKSAIIEQLTGLLNEYNHFYVADASGLNAEETSNLRRACFGQDIKLVVAKNTLLKKALESKGDFSPIFNALEGPTAILLSNVGNAPAKLIKDFSGKNKAGKPVLKAAYVEESFYGADQLDALVAIKSKNELIADVIALLQSPAKNVLSALQSSGSTIHGVLKTLSER
ncbi:MAG: 50S ribosomal protein L10 [Paludibacteraceae bacterium]|nr:50S ribosomal protein L10 [Paludibacteraceae bacterium]MBR4838902.1 50S ribosomal protein L10 [Paludibacteraceae bacterium]